ncbi:hypothetical protein SNE40_023119 [Patella caerulea]|uniref:G-protein coupled receptors family 1 profile domain-containing protein n=1 Tax=Patella caerulea TaxID=87958 RepID=A0AAN8IVS0_PATCE
MENTTATEVILYNLSLLDIRVENSTGSLDQGVPDNPPLIIYDHHLPKFEPPILILICVVLGLMILATIIGNVFVITAIIVEKSLQGVSNYLILSLGVTDLMVAVLVMPLSLVNEVSVYWYLGAEICDMWISIDVLCCTASILHLVAIAVDRYWAVSNIDYIRRRCARGIILMVVVVWFVAISVSLPPLFGWKEETNNPELIGMCIISQNKVYTVFSTVGAFYFPLFLMLILNYKIYKAARSRIRKKKFGGRPHTRPMLVPQVTIENGGNPSRNSSGSDVSQDGFSVYNGSCVVMNEISRMESTIDATDIGTNGELYNESKFTIGNSLTVPTNVFVLTKNRSNNNSKQVKNREKDKLRKEKIEMRRERKAARVLGIITGAFIVCWLPFFIIAVVAPFCAESCTFPPPVFSVFLWLGYFNSLLNPIIYTIFNPNFRVAFRKILFGKIQFVKR